MGNGGHIGCLTAPTKNYFCSIQLFSMFDFFDKIYHIQGQLMKGTFLSGSLRFSLSTPIKNQDG
jgi:hypothetical protein